MNRHLLSRTSVVLCIATLAVAFPVLTQAVVLQVVGSTNQPPVIEDPLKLPDNTKKVEPKVPIGKTLMIPIAASDPEGQSISYKVTSSDPDIMVRVRTGRPHLKISVDYAGNPASETPDPGFTGELEFQIFRDWTPETASFISGFAQSLYYSPVLADENEDGEDEIVQQTIFHRVIKDFMCQTGDPNSQLPDTEPPDDPVVRGPGFAFDDELGVPMIFSGRGQMAMANAGFASNFKGTNGSQFFITTGSPRHLDFKHTILGQLVRGWDILEKMQNVPVKEQESGGEVSRPKTEIKITGTSVAPNSTDALLVISARSKGKANITVIATDSEGGETRREFEVEAFVDTTNSGPFFTKNIPDRNLPKNKAAKFSFQAQDLEHDFITYQAGVIEGGSNGSAQLAGTKIQLVPRTGYSGPLRLAYAMTQYDMGSLFGRGFDGARSVQLAVGEKDYRSKPVPVFGAPNVALNNVPLATFVDSDARGSAGGATVSVNWGDGTPTSSGSLSFDRSRASITGYQVNGSHVYARPGMYPLVVTLTSSLGLSEVIRTVAVISSQTLRLVPQDFTIGSRKISKRRLAKIFDETPGKPGDYQVTLDWGDGSSSAGDVKRSGAGDLYVIGSHNYADPDTYSVEIRVKKLTGEDPPTATTWTNVTAKFPVKESYLPPFAMGHIVAGLSNIFQAPNVPKPFRKVIGAGANETTVLTFNLGILNSGNKKTKPSKIRFYLSTDRVLNLENETYMDETVDPPVERNRPKDIPLMIGKSEKEISLIGLTPGLGGGIPFDLTSLGDSRVYLPKGETGAGYNLLAALVYDDPLAKLSPIAREEIIEILPPFSPVAAGVELTETTGPKHTQSFEVEFSRKPTAPVTVPLAAVQRSSGSADTTEFYFNAIPPVPPEDDPDLPSDENLVSTPDHSITFTPEMWDAGTRKVAVQVTGKQDGVRDNNQEVAVRIGPSTSNDPRYHGKLGRLLNVVVVDRDSLITINPSSIVTDEAAGTSHSKTIEVKMTKKPAADVILPIINNDLSEGVLTAGNGELLMIDDKPSLKFTPGETYPAKRTLTVTSVDDGVTDGTAVYIITVGPSSSTDVEFNAIKPPNITVSNLDNPVTPPPGEDE